MKTFLPILFIFLLLSCDRIYYNGSIAVEQHSWQLQTIDTFYARGKYRPSATWYEAKNRIFYVDNNHEFPYPYQIGAYLANFDRR